MQIVPCESTPDEVSFEWSHHRISTTDSKVTITVNVSITDFGSEKVKVPVEVGDRGILFFSPHGHCRSRKQANIHGCYVGCLYFFRYSNMLIISFSFIFQYVLMELIKKELKSWSETLRIDNVPKAPSGIMIVKLLNKRQINTVFNGNRERAMLL